MTWICEVVVGGDPQSRPALDAWLSQAADAWTRIECLSALDLYKPAEQQSRDPYNHDGDGPPLIAVFDFEDEGSLRSVINSGALDAPLAVLPNRLDVTISVFEREFYEVADGRPLGLGSAPISYVVRYHRPASDEALFIKNYVDSHPPTQAKLPHIRAIACYFPRPHVSSHGFKSHDYLIGNEVVFDSVDDFNNAMASPVRQELRAHYREFPPFSGATTHHLMRRTRVVG